MKVRPTSSALARTFELGVGVPVSSFILLEEWERAIPFDLTHNTVTQKEADSVDLATLTRLIKRR